MGSPKLFVMGVMVINIVESRLGYRDEKFYVPVLFYADDGLLLAGSSGEAEEMIRVVVDASGGCGLKINKGKSSVLMYNCGEDRLDEVGGIRVANTISNCKYNFFSNCEIMQ